MNTALMRAGRTLASALLCLMPTMVFAAAPFTLIRSVPKTQTAGAVSPDGKTLTFTQKIIRLVAETGPESDMLSYRIDSLRNPMLVVPKGAALTLLFVNTDDDMAHNIRFGTVLSAYPNVMTASLKSSVGTPELDHKSKTALHGEELTLRMPDAPGVYGYWCTVRGHAQGGMVGKVVVR